MRIIQTIAAATVAMSPLIAFADSPNISIECKNPSASAVFSPTGTDSQGVGEGRSPTFQFNINTAARSGQAIFVNKNNWGICKATIGSGYQITSGRAVISQTNVYTDYNRQSSSRPKVNEILNFVTATAGETLTDSIEFTVRSSTEEYKGTINVVFVVKYKAVN